MTAGPSVRSDSRHAAAGRVLHRVWLVAVILVSATHATEPAPPLLKMVSHVAMSRMAFSRVNENDASVAYKILTAELGKKLGYDLSVDVTLFDSLPDFAQAIRDGRATYIITDTWNVLAMHVEDALDVEFSAVNGDSAIHRWLLLVRRDAGIKSIADLKGRKVIMLYNNMSSLGPLWLETVLLEQGLGTPGQCFNAYETVSKPTVAVLPVFFGRAQACVVDEAAFKVMSEMNPQLGQTLEPLAQSEPLLGGIVGFSHNGWPTEKARTDMRARLANLETEPAGRQLLTLFKCTRLVPCEPAQLDSVRRLFARHLQLQNAPRP